MTHIDVQKSTHPASPEERAKALQNPHMGEQYSDHMAVATWSREGGWSDVTIKGVEPFSMHPGNGIFHYAQEIFEGMKAYRRADDSIWMFRPEKNAARFARSARRLQMPPIDEEVFLEAVKTLVDIDRDWVPERNGEQSLYLRPFMIANEIFLGVRPAQSYTFCVLASPSGAYYPDPVHLWATPNFTRAARGGTGDAKCGGNYAASLAAAEEAREHDCDQVVWLDGAEHKWVEECGTMNLMFVTADGELLTAALGTILEGVTRDSILTIAPEHGLVPVERKISIDEVFERIADGSIVESFACGTAAIITPVAGYKGPGREDVDFGTVPGPKTKELREHLLGMQFGEVEDPRGWTIKIGD